MKAAGVIVEYNPFHNGHQYHLKKTKELTGADFVIAIMSGNFVQRGIPAITDKYTRTRMALLNGADIVLELPCAYALASAEIFAFGAVSILDGLGTLDSICFGAESDQLSLMLTTAQILLDEPEEYRTVLKDGLSAGLSFPLARKKALLSFWKHGKDEISSLLDTPNNILSIEYLKALLKRSSSLTPFLLKRQGAGYLDQTLPSKNSFPSAASLRMHYEAEKTLAPYQGYVPENVFSILTEQENKTFPILPDDFSEYLYYKLLSISYEELLTCQDVTEDLARRILNQRNHFLTISSFAQELKSKQYTLTRIQRVLMHILLDIKKGAKPPLYARILGFHKSAAFLLNKSAASLPLITKTANHKELFAHDIYCTELYNHVIYKKFQVKIPNDYQHPLIIL